MGISRVKVGIIKEKKTALNPLYKRLARFS